MKAKRTNSVLGAPDEAEARRALSELSDASVEKDLKAAEAAARTVRRYVAERQRLMREHRKSLRQRGAGDVRSPSRMLRALISEDVKPSKL